MKNLYILSVVILSVCISGCSSNEQANESDTSYIVENVNGDIELSPELMPYKEVILKELPKDSSYAMARIAGCDEPILLLSDKCLWVENADRRWYVSNEAVAYTIIDGEVRYLGKLQAGTAYSLAIDQLGNMYTAQVKNVSVWNVDLEKQNLIPIEAAYIENGQHMYCTEKEVLEVDSEFYLMCLHEKYGKALPIEFVPLQP